MKECIRIFFKSVKITCLVIIGICLIGMLLNKGLFLIYDIQTEIIEKKYSIKVKTEYGDIIYAEYDCDEHEWWITSEYSHTIIWGLNEDSVKTLYATPDLRVYLVKDLVLLYIEDSQFFGSSNNNLKISNSARGSFYDFSTKEFVETVKSILLANNNILNGFWASFKENYPTEADELYNNFKSGNYDALKKYGLSQKVISDSAQMQNIEKILESEISKEN